MVTREGWRRRLGRGLGSLALMVLVAAAPARVKAPEATAAFTAGNYAEAYRLIGAAITDCRAPSSQPDRCLDLLEAGANFALTAGDAKTAERWAREALVLAKALPERGEDTLVMVTLAGALIGQGRLAEAEALDREALPLAQKALGANHPFIAAIQNNLALLLDARGQHGEAEPLHRAVIASVRATQGETAGSLPTLLNGLADNLKGQARYKDADPVYAEAVALARKISGPQHPTVALALNSLADLKQTLGQFAQAEALYNEAAAIDRTALGPNHPLVGRDLANLGGLYLNEGRLAEAETQFRAAVAIAEAADGPDHPAVASDLGNLAGVLVQLGRPEEAEPLTRRALSIDRKAFGEDAPRLGGQYASLAMNLEAQQRASEAEALRRRALAIDKAAYGDAHPDTAASLSGLAGNLSLQGKYADAEPLLRQALAAQEAALGADSLAVAGTLASLGVLEASAGRPAEAEPMFRRSLDIRRARLGEQAPGTATGLHNLAALLELLARPAEAEAPARQALAIRRAILPPNHPDVAASETLLARILAAKPATNAEALAHARAAMTIVRARRTQAGAATGTSGAARAELSARATRSLRNPVDRAFWAFLEAAAKSPDAARLNDEAFVAAQDLEVSAAGLAMAQTAARTAAGSGDLAQLARRQQDLSARVRALDTRAVEALGQGLADKATSLRAELETTAADLAAVDAQLRQRHPAYATLVAPRPLTIAEVRGRLAADEGLLLIIPSGADLYAFAMSGRASAWRRLPDGVAKVRGQVAALRCSVDPGTCADTRGEPPPFDPAIAHALYAELVKPVEPGLGGAKRLFVTASGPLADLPLDALVVALPKAAKTRFEGVAWLGDRYAITSLPSVSVLRTRQADARRPAGPGVFVGYGDPAFAAGKDGATRGAGGDLARLRGLAPLPGTRVELNAMAHALAAPAGSVVLGAAATEPAVRGDPRIGKAGVVAFATHGLLPGELNGRNEPALVFSPPDVATPANDGLLSASEVSELALTADWVVLSACNTASAEGGSDSLSALARAFLYAGARALLATHWRVADEPTAALTVEMLSTAATHPELSRAEARQRAIQAVRSGRRADGTAVAGWTSEWRDPAAWAPFTLIAASSD